MDNRIETGTDSTGSHAVIEFPELPVIEFPDDDLAAEHPFDAAERVLAATS
jgi:hypothetical protein